MKMKLVKVWNCGPLLQKLANSKGPSAKANYWVARLLTRLASELDSIEKQRRELIRKYGTEDDKKNVTVTPENNEVFTKELSELLETEIDFEFTPIEAEYLEGSELTSQDFATLDFAIKEPK